jgi:hypothetical protein
VRDLTIRDPTQIALLPELERTERLLAAVASKASGKECDAEIVAMSDLGIATNVGRMQGGFFTGALYRWDAPVPIAPVDATVNVCSVSLHRVQSPPDTQDEFLRLVEAAKRRCGFETEYQWNLAAGNHFVSLGSIQACNAFEGGDYLMLHASASEYKRTPHGLYPGPSVWFKDQIRSLDDGARQLRYLAGEPAERFISTAHALVDYNARRHQVLAGLIGDGLRIQHVECRAHYGMPDNASVAIGCHWLESASPEPYFLLTEPNADIPIIEPRIGLNTVPLGGNDRLLTPHGLGVRSKDGRVRLTDEGIVLGDSELEANVAVLGSADTEWRSLRRDKGLLKRILSVAPGTVVGWFKPHFSYHRALLSSGTG